MLLRIPDVLTPAELGQAARLLRSGNWLNGRVTAGHQSWQAELPPGQLVLYPATGPHCDDGQRSLLFALDASIQHRAADHPDHPAAVLRTGVYHNLLRQWAEI